MAYFDERLVSRIDDVAVEDHALTWTRDHPTIAQVVSIRMQPNGTLVSTGRISENGGPWGDGLSQTFQRSSR